MSDNPILLPCPRHGPRGPRGLKHDTDCIVGISSGGRGPRGPRGLKQEISRRSPRRNASRPARAAWIETLLEKRPMSPCGSRPARAVWIETAQAWPSPVMLCVTARRLWPFVPLVGGERGMCRRHRLFLAGYGGTQDNSGATARWILGVKPSGSFLQRRRTIPGQL